MGGDFVCCVCRFLGVPLVGLYSSLCCVSVAFQFVSCVVIWWYFIWAIVVGCCFRLFVILIRPYVFLHGFGSHVFGVVGYRVPFLYFVILFC